MREEHPVDLANELSTRLRDYELTFRDAPDQTIGLEDLAALSEDLSFLERAHASIEELFDIRGTLGQGGMCDVKLARQISLGRDVAIKMLAGENRRQDRAALVLQEAWVTGALEHPCVPPIYDVGVDKEGFPLIVLRRVQGALWSELIRDAEQVQRRFRTADLLEWNLQILMQLCHPLSYAHSRGIIHRDVKPGNVMVGEFGEVYLLDWGLAVAVRECGIRAGAASRAVVGTPWYMAPEMLCHPDRVSERTDVYLLGAVLHEIATGRPPHQRGSFEETLRSIVSAPELDGSPPELASICRRAMELDPDARFDSVEELRLAIRDFLQHSQAIRLAERAEAVARELVTELQSDAGDPARRARFYDLFGECRFGFRQALATWPEYRLAAAGLQQAASAMVQYELGRGDPAAAGSLLAELDAAPAELQEKVRAAAATLEERQRQAEWIVKEHDLSVGWRARRAFVAVLGLLGTLAPLLLHLTPTGRMICETHAGAMYLDGALSLFVLLGFLAIRKTAWRNLVHRRMSLTLLLVFPSSFALAAGARALGIPDAAVHPLHLFVWFLFVCAYAIFAEWRLVPTALSFLVGFFAAIGWPARSFLMEAAASLVLTVNILAIWRPAPAAPLSKAPPRSSAGRRG